MKRYDFLLLIFLMLVSPLAICEDLSSVKAELSSLLNQGTADRTLLVAFSDRYINRFQRSANPASYRRRGPYKSSTWSKRITIQIGEQYSLQKLTEWSMTEVGLHCAVYLVPIGQSMEKTIARLEQEKRVQVVQKMNLFKTKAHKYNDPYYKLQTNMHNMQISLAHGVTTGRNVTIAMIDTGVDIDHPDLIGQIEINKNFAFGISSSFSNDMHGTAVAGIMVARTDNETGIIGVAPNARLIVLKACWPSQAGYFEATCNSYTLALAVNTAIKLGADVLNMSLTGPKDPLLEILLNKAMEKGIIVVAADPDSTKENEGFPASLKNVISVQGMRKSESNKKIKNQSINAPGLDILTTLPHGTYDFISGSSISAAHVSGIIALLLELKPDLTLDESRKVLKNSAHVLCSTTTNGQNCGINANMAVLEICDEVTCLQKL